MLCQDGLIFLDNEVTFPSLADLIEHYYSHALPHHGSLCLQKPYANLLDTWPALPGETWVALTIPVLSNPTLETSERILVSSSACLMRESEQGGKEIYMLTIWSSWTPMRGTCKESKIWNIHVLTENMRRGKRPFNTRRHKKGQICDLGGTWNPS